MARLIAETPAAHRAAAPAFFCGHLAEAAKMSKTRFSESLTASARASVIWAYERLIEIKTHVPVRMERHLSFLLDRPQPRGRPKGKLQYDDELYLIEMGRLLETRVSTAE